MGRCMKTGNSEKNVEKAKPTLEGVTWSPKYGAVCPHCARTKTPTNTTRPWEGAYRIRYHRCPECGLHIKSIETDYTLESNAYEYMSSQHSHAK